MAVTTSVVQCTQPARILRHRRACELYCHRLASLWEFPATNSLVSSLTSSLGPKLLSRTGKQMYCVDQWSPKGRPLLVVMADPGTLTVLVDMRGPAFMLILYSFRPRIL